MHKLTYTRQIFKYIWEQQMLLMMIFFSKSELFSKQLRFKSIFHLWICGVAWCVGENHRLKLISLLFHYELSKSKTVDMFFVYKTNLWLHTSLSLYPTKTCNAEQKDKRKIDVFGYYGNLCCTCIYVLFIYCS